MPVTVFMFPSGGQHVEVELPPRWAPACTQRLCRRRCPCNRSDRRPSKSAHLNKQSASERAGTATWQQVLIDNATYHICGAYWAEPSLARLLHERFRLWTYYCTKCSGTCALKWHGVTAVYT